MAFVFNEFGALLASDPKVAHKRLRELFVQYGGNTKELARAIGVNRGTVFRWIKKLEAGGFGDPRRGDRGRGGRRPAHGNPGFHAGSEKKQAG